MNNTRTPKSAIKLLFDILRERPAKDEKQEDQLLEKATIYIQEIKHAAENRSVVKRLLGIDRNISLDAKDENGVTLLSGAAYNGHTRILRTLLDCKAKVDAPSANVKGEKITPLNTASIQGNTDCVQVLLEHKATINSATLTNVAYHNRTEELNLLIEHKANVNLPSQYGALPIAYAAEQGHVEAVKELLVYKSRINTVDCKGLTPLKHAAQQGHKHIVRLLAHAGAKVDIQRSTLIYAPMKQWHTEGKPDANAKIGSGTTTIVYKGSMGEESVAIKCPIDLSIIESFALETEATMMRRLSSPYIVRFLGILTTPGAKNLVTEYMPDGDLRRCLEKSTLDWRTRIKIAFDICSALVYLHRHNIIHNDIKSHNVLLDQNDAKLADFGSACERTSFGFAHGYTAGTYGWIAPEIKYYYSDNKPNTMSDMYSFGVLLFELAQNAPEKAAVFIDNYNIDRPLSLLEEKGHCPPVFATLIRDCISDTPRHRPTASQALERLVLILKLNDLFDANIDATKLVTPLTPRRRMP